MKKIIDLHVHTIASDGLYTPTGIVEKAKKAGLSAIGIADHDTIDGIKEAISAGKKLGIEVVPSVEITSYWSKQNRREFHILGYYIDLNNKKLNSTLKQYQQRRIERGRKIVKKLKDSGFAISYQKVRTLAQGAIGRPHLARAVIENKENEKKLIKIFNKIPDISEFIGAYIVPGKPAYVDKAGLEPDETIKLIHQAKGLAILAHPGWSLKISEGEIIKQFVDWKIDGLEAIHGMRTKEESLKCIRYFSKLAKKYNLLITGGSDFHADRKEEPGESLGLLNWKIEIPYELLERIKEKLSTS